MVATDPPAAQREKLEKISISVKYTNFGISYGVLTTFEFDYFGPPLAQTSQTWHTHQVG